MADAIMHEFNAINGTLADQEYASQIYQRVSWGILYGEPSALTIASIQRLIKDRDNA